MHNDYLHSPWSRYWYQSCVLSSKTAMSNTHVKEDDSRCEFKFVFSHGVFFMITFENQLSTDIAKRY